MLFVAECFSYSAFFISHYLIDISKDQGHIHKKNNKEIDFEINKRIRLTNVFMLLVASRILA